MSYINDILKYTHQQLCDYFLNKYGAVSGDFFVDIKCQVKNHTINKIKDGLYVHHRYSNIAPLLSIPEYAIKYKFDYQKGPNLVYCNLLEHFLLHVKVIEELSENLTNDEYHSFAIPIFIYFVPMLNDIYSGIEYEQHWKNLIAINIFPFRNEYISMIKLLTDVGFDRRYALNTSKGHDNSNNWTAANNKNLFKEFKKIGVKSNKSLFKKGK